MDPSKARWNAEKRGHQGDTPLRRQRRQSWCGPRKGGCETEMKPRRNPGARAHQNHPRNTRKQPGRTNTTPSPPTILPSRTTTTTTTSTTTTATMLPMLPFFSFPFFFSALLPSLSSLPTLWPPNIEHAARSPFLISSYRIQSMHPPRRDRGRDNASLYPLFVSRISPRCALDRSIRQLWKRSGEEEKNWELIVEKVVSWGRGLQLFEVKIYKYAYRYNIHPDYIYVFNV